MKSQDCLDIVLVNHSKFWQPRIYIIGLHVSEPCVPDFRVNIFIYKHITCREANFYVNLLSK